MIREYTLPLVLLLLLLNLFEGYSYNVDGSERKGPRRLWFWKHLRRREDRGGVALFLRGGVEIDFMILFFRYLYFYVQIFPN